MSTLAKVKKRAKELGAIVEDYKEFGVHELTVEAPSRFRWDGDLHQFVCCVYQPDKPDYADMLDRMDAELTPCTDPDCDWCNPLGEVSNAI